MWAYLALVGAVFSGTLLAKTLHKNTRINHLLLIFSGAYLLCITLLHVFPLLFENSSEKTSLFIVVGIIIQMMLESFSKGIEHGHAHNLKRLSLPIIFGLMMHAFLEGMPIGEMPHSKSILIAIIIHKIPIAAILYLSLTSLFNNINKVYLFMLIFSLMTPLGSLVGQFIFSKQYYYYILATISGIFIHISTTILFENSSDSHRLSLTKLSMILLITLLVWIT